MGKSEGKRKMEISVVLFIWVISASTLVHCQRQIGFISIDCGSSKAFYDDTDTGIMYTYDSPYADTGVNSNISKPYLYPNNPNLPFPLSDLRSFPQGNKNCYTLSPGPGSTNLIRAVFLYGNYDGKDHLPEFDLYLDVNLWTTVKFRNASEVFTAEIIATASSGTTYVCLVNKGLGVPFISALELRPVNSSVYNTEFGNNASLVLFQRSDVGMTNGTGRYQDDVYDRVWSSNFSSASVVDSIRTSFDVNNYENGYRVPLEVIKTAGRPISGGDSLELVWNTSDSSTGFYVYLHFAELELLQTNQSRKFSVSWNGNTLFRTFSPIYLYSTTASNSQVLVGKEHRISIRKTADSTLPPILNAVEIFRVMNKTELMTHADDAQAILEVKTTYRIARNWAGDPCGPRNYSWIGLECSHNGLIPPRIISLNLTSSNLTGAIASSISKLSYLESLDLSNNNLHGPLPKFLIDMKSLKLIDLRGNRLFGVVPDALLERSRNGSLVLRVDSRNLCGSDPCKTKSNNIVVPIVASLVPAVVLLIAFLIIWKLRRDRKSGLKKGGYVAIKKSQFSYSEVVEISDNFKTEIGKGGFGPVYHGCMKDGTQVAIKMLSSSSSQGPKEFQTEAELLMRIHHRNLVSFVGYCDDGKKLALIYEYMPKGNLKVYLSDKDLQLNWETRLRIAVDAAQGLEYLHNGCKPGIVHRDVKTANILLGEKLDAKIADFGLSKVFANDNEAHVETAVMGTAGYLDPEYYSSQMLNEKSDVFSFGVVLLELITGKPAIIKGEETLHVIQWVRYELEEGEMRNIIDPRIKENVDEDSVRKALDVAMACTTSTSEHRATMGFVLSELKRCLGIEFSKDDEERSSTMTQSYRPYLYSNNTPELSLTCTDIKSTDSVSTPLAR